MMKTKSWIRFAATILAALANVASAAAAANESVPLIVIDEVPLSAAIQNLARHAELNYILDPRVPGSGFGPGRLATEPSVSIRRTDTTALAVLEAVLKEHKLQMVTNPATTVARIAPANLVVQPVPASQVGTNAGKVVPVLSVDSVSLTDLLMQLASAARLKVSLDPKLTAPPFARQGTVSFRWERITVKQAFLALLDNYDLVMIEDAAGSTAKITRRSDSGKERP
jgi:hypothetical protein